MIVPWPLLEGLHKRGLRDSHGSGLIVADFATGGVDVGLRGDAVGFNVQVCDADRGQKGLDRRFGPSTRLLGKVR
jgi:hypothetical protein